VNLVVLFVYYVTGDGPIYPCLSKSGSFSTVQPNLVTVGLPIWYIVG